MTIAQRLLTMTTVRGQDYEDTVDAANDNGGSITAVVAHLRETRAGRVEGHTTLVQLQAQPPQLHHVIWGGDHYWLQIDHQQCFYALHAAENPEDDTTA